jgi:histidyl-tRNA synthetase
LKIPYELNPFLVRGLDYYTKTVFEIFFVKETPKAKEKEEEGQNIPDPKPVQEDAGGLSAPEALAGGGRYDALARLLGGKDSPAAGFAAGVERIVARMKEENVALPKIQEPVLFLAQLGDSAKKKSLHMLEELRKAKIPAAESVGKSSLKSQLHLADRLNAKLTIINGQEVVLHNNAILREMDSGSQETVSQGKLVEEVKKRLKGK